MLSIAILEDVTAGNRLELYFSSILSVGSLSVLSMFEECIVYVDSQNGMSVPLHFH